ncbi:MAG: putative redox protein [Phycisphaerales bacterium]|jgi:putative redox protein
MTESNRGPHLETFAATANGTGWPTSVKLTGTDWAIQVDESVEDGGSNSGPNPMHHLVASLAGCQNEQAQVVAEEMGVTADRIDFTVEVELNLDGFMGVADHSEGCFQAVRLEAKIAGLNTDQVAQLGERVDARCPILSLLRSGGANIQTSWTAG